MTVRSTEPCVQLYTGVSLDGSLIGKSGRPYGKHGALCLECEGYPDGPNHPELGDIILRPGSVYRQKTVYAVAELRTAMLMRRRASRMEVMKMVQRRDKSAGSYWLV